jgi:pilus assembly protein CpaE
MSQTQTAFTTESTLPRQKFSGFVHDASTANLLRSALGQNFPPGCEIHITSFRNTLNVLSRIPTPEILLIDLTGEEQPITAMMDLAELVEPGTKVLLVGEAHELSFYRNVVEGMGVREYLAKPLQRETVVRYFLPYFRAEEDTDDAKRGGRLMAVMGVRGGIGTSTIAANLAWSIGNETHRHTLLLDGDLQSGTAALSLNLEAGKGLVAALESPDRLDTIMLERVSQRVGERLHLLAAQEDYNKPVQYVPGSATILTKALRQRYNYIVSDAGARTLPFARDLLFVANQRIIVMDPSTMALRNFERVNALPASAKQVAKPLLVLNHAGRPGGLTQKSMEQSLGVLFDAVIPDLPRIVPKADQFGDMAASIRGPFRTGILKLTEALGISSVITEKVKA